jgi:hypothetical protein
MRHVSSGLGFEQRFGTADGMRPKGEQKENGAAIINRAM